jgi:hypothetical protein
MLVRNLSVWEEVDDLPHHAALSGWLMMMITGAYKYQSLRSLYMMPIKMVVTDLKT